MDDEVLLARPVFFKKENVWSAEVYMSNRWISAGQGDKAVLFNTQKEVVKVIENNPGLALSNIVKIEESIYI